MDLLEGVEVACFDLFDTLIRIDTERLPEVAWDGETVRSTIPLLHERLFAARGVALPELVVAIRAMWLEVRRELRVASGPDDVRWREVPAVEKYRRLLRRLDAVAEAEVDALAEAVADAHHAALVSAALAIDGASEVLAAVRARGIPTVLVSNWDHARAGQAMLARTGLGELLDRVVISEAVGVRKPHPRIFQEALAPFGAAPEAALHVGDLAEADAWGAGRLGMKTVWIDRRGEGWSATHGPPPTLTVRSLADLRSRLGR